MSYDLRIGVKVEGAGKIVMIAEPELANPTYNLGNMFRACMGWDYKQGEYYKCSNVIGNIANGIKELRTNKKQYVKYEPSNGWGTISGALETLESLWECINETAEYNDLSLENLYVAW